MRSHDPFYHVFYGLHDVGGAGKVLALDVFFQ